MVRVIGGIRRPIGADRPKKGKGGPAAVALVLGVSLGAGGLGVHVSTTDAASSSRTRGGIRVELRVDAERTARTVVRLRHRGLRVNYSEASDTDCGAHAHGQVASFLREHPCVAMHRTLLVITDPDLGPVLLAVARVHMPSRSSAAALKALIDRPGSGNITELSRERGPYRTVRFTGQFYRASQLDTTVTNAQAQPVLPGRAGRRLTELVNEGVM